jgi:leader peptidase (prepilin peptidase) / N-methyltransferase
VELVLAFLAGLLVGSFLNVCIYRLPRDLSVASPARSFCPGCERMIAWYDNVPLLSYALLGGKCRHCRATIPLRYPVVEFVTAILFAVVVAKFGVTLAGLKMALFCAIMVDLVATDFEERILPDEFTLGGAVLGLVLAWLVPIELDIASLVFFFSGMQVPSLQVGSLVEAMLGALIGSGLLLGIAKLYEKIRQQEGMGLGDVKMMLTIGAFLGLRPALLIFFIASLVGSVSGLLFIWLAGKDRNYELPLGSYLGAVAIAVALWLV